MIGAGGVSTVGWDADPVVVARSPLPPLSDDVTADVCVVGLGGSGLAAVEDVLDRGLSVVGVDAGRVGAGAAGRNGGILTPTPGIGYARAAQAWGMAQLAAFHAAASAEIDLLATILGSCAVRRTGSLRLVEAPWALPVDAGTQDGASDIAAEWADVEEQSRILSELGITVEDYDGPLGRGVFVPDEAAMNPARRVIGLAGILAGRGHGAALYEDSPVIAMRGTTVRTPNRAMSAGVVLVAVDGLLGRILPELAALVRPVRLQMLATDPVTPGLLPYPIHLRWGFDYAQQVDRPHLLRRRSRSNDRPGVRRHTAPSALVQDWIEGQAYRLVGRPVTVTHRWAATAGYTDDGLPVVARPRPGVVACGGYCGTGNVVGMLAAKAALRWGLDGTRPPVWFTSG